MPCITTVIYEGFDETGEFGHLFKIATNEHDQENVEEQLLSYEDGEIHGILDKPALIRWLEAKHNHQSVAKEYEYKAL